MGDIHGVGRENSKDEMVGGDMIFVVEVCGDHYHVLIILILLCLKSDDRSRGLSRQGKKIISI